MTTHSAEHGRPVGPLCKKSAKNGWSVTIWLNVLSSITCSTSHRQAGTPVMRLQLTLRITADLYKNNLSQHYLVVPVIHVQSLCSQICVHIHIFFTL